MTFIALYIAPGEAVGAALRRAEIPDCRESVRISNLISYADECASLA